MEVSDPSPQCQESKKKKRGKKPAAAACTEEPIKSSAETISPPAAQKPSILAQSAWGKPAQAQSQSKCVEEATNKPASVWGKPPSPPPKATEEPAPAPSCKSAVTVPSALPGPAPVVLKPASMSGPQAALKGAFMEKGVRLITNMYGLNDNSVTTLANKIHRYEMDVIDGSFSSKTPANLERALVYALRRLPEFKGCIMMTDGSKILYSLQDLAPLVEAAQTARGMSELSIDNKKSSSADLIAKTSEGLKIQVNHPKSQRKYTLLLRPAAWDPNDSLQKVQMLQVAVKYSFYEQNREVLFRGRSIFNQADFVQLGDLILFTGVFQSCRFNGYSKPILNVDLSYTVSVNSSITVSRFFFLSISHPIIFCVFLHIAQWMDGYAQHCRFRNFCDAMRNKRFADGIQSYLKGMLVATNYGNKVVYRLEGLEEQMTPSSVKFKDKDGKETTVSNYFATKYPTVELFTKKYDEHMYKKPLDDDGYLLIVRQTPKAAKSPDGASNRRVEKPTSRLTYLLYRYFILISLSVPTYVPSELCSFTAGQRRKADLDARETSEMINHTRKVPAERFQIIDSKVREVVQNLNAQGINLGVELKSIFVKAEEADAFERTIVYKGGNTKPNNGGWDIVKLYGCPANAMSWGVIVDETMNKGIYDEFVKRFIQVCRSVQFPVQPPVALRAVKPETFESVLRKNATKGFAFFLCVLPPRAPADLYASIKSTSYVELGVVTQCVVDDQYKKRGQNWIKLHDESVLKNLVISINAKLDNENCLVAEPEVQEMLHPVLPSEVLLMGLDVFHGDTSDPEHKPSIVALTASRNSHFNRYATVLRSQHPKQELVVDKGVDNLSGMITEVLELRAGSLPKHVILYRDGVGEGMYPAVLEHEVHTLHRKLGEMYYNAKLEAPKITVIISQKRNHFRTRETVRNDNPPPGTLVDDMLVIDEGLPNFYLYSHKALAGTARPTHYHVLYDENGFSRDQVASFTHALTHLHQGCTKSVSIPAPVYYADLACYLAGSCFRSQVDQISAKIKVTPYMI